MPVTRFIRVSITVADLAGAAAFYRDALGLEIGPERSLDDPAWNALFGLSPGTTARACRILVRQQTFDIVAFEPPGKPYPSDRASNDQWFQHFSLVCGDIGQVSKRLKAAHPGVITEGSPVLLPPNTGSVTAFKFRDPEGHPLELISFPEGVGAPQWHEMSDEGILGYDHTAISVMDLERSLSFYTGLLGMHIAGRSLNQGPEQDEMDALQQCEVDVLALEPTVVAKPHVELLHYRTPTGRVLTAPLNTNDVAAARQVHEVDDFDALVGRLEAEGVPFVSPGIVSMENGGKAVSIRDPDEHMLVLLDAVAAERLG